VGRSLQACNHASRRLTIPTVPLYSLPTPSRCVGVLSSETGWAVPSAFPSRQVEQGVEGDRPRAWFGHRRRCHRVPGELASAPAKEPGEPGACDKVANASLTVRVARLAGTHQLSSTPSLPGCGGGAFELKTGSAVWALRPGSPPRGACGPCRRHSEERGCTVQRSIGGALAGVPADRGPPATRSSPDQIRCRSLRSPKRAARSGPRGSCWASEEAWQFVSCLTPSCLPPKEGASSVHRGRRRMTATGPRSRAVSRRRRLTLTLSAEAVRRRCSSKCCHIVFARGPAALAVGSCRPVRERPESVSLASAVWEIVLVGAAVEAVRLQLAQACLRRATVLPSHEQVPSGSGVP
jgi:hypothetical protein